MSDQRRPPAPRPLPRRCAAAIGGAALLLAAAAAGARTTIGVYRGWGAFRDRVPPRCFAIARPVVANGRAGGFASVAVWPGRAPRATLYVRLSRASEPATPVTLTIGERRFALAAGGSDARAPDAAGDRAVVAAMRSARSMSIEAIGAGGQPFADVYALPGAATAIDAATLACRDAGTG